MSLLKELFLELFYPNKNLSPIEYFTTSFYDLKYFHCLFCKNYISLKNDYFTMPCDHCKGVLYCLFKGSSNNHYISFYSSKYRIIFGLTEYPFVVNLLTTTIYLPSNYISAFHRRFLNNSHERYIDNLLLLM